jgi:hypothetical protein
LGFDSSKYVGAIKYKTPQPVAHAQRAPQVVVLFFNYAQILTALRAQPQSNKNFESVAKQRFQNFYCGSFDR